MPIHHVENCKFASYELHTLMIHLQYFGLQASYSRRMILFDLASHPSKIRSTPQWMRHVYFDIEAQAQGTESRLEISRRRHRRDCSWVRCWCRHEILISGSSFTPGLDARLSKIREKASSKTRKYARHSQYCSTTCKA